MIKGVANGPPVGDQPDRRGQGEEEPKTRRPKTAGRYDRPPDGGPKSDLRLVVATEEATGAVSYHWVDRETGEVVTKISREDLPRISGDPLYEAGDWLDTLA